MYYYSIKDQNFGHLLGQTVLYSIAGNYKFVLCKVEKINTKLVTLPISGFFNWMTYDEIPDNLKYSPIIYNY